MEIGNNIKWSHVLEGFFKDMGEKSFCYGYLHKKCEAKYSGKRNFIDLPVIVLSTVAGTLSIGSSSVFPKEYERESSMGIGILSLFVSVLNTVGTYFSFAKRAEAHRQSSIQYQKLYRFLDIELSLPRKERMRPTDMLKVCRDTYERLAEVSPLIPYDILKGFKKRFRKYDVAKPSEANGLECIDIYQKKKKSKYTCHSDDEDFFSDDESSSSRLDSSELEEVVVEDFNKTSRNIYSNESFIKPKINNMRNSRRMLNVNTTLPDISIDTSRTMSIPNMKSSIENIIENSASNMTENQATQLLSLLKKQNYSMPANLSTISNLGNRQFNNNSMMNTMNNMNNMNNAINNGMNTMNNGMNNAINNGMNTMNNGMNNAINNGMNNAINNGMNNAINNGMNNAINNGMNTMNNAINTGMNTMNNGMNIINSINEVGEEMKESMEYIEEAKDNLMKKSMEMLNLPEIEKVSELGGNIIQEKTNKLVGGVLETVTETLNNIVEEKNDVINK